MIPMVIAHVAPQCATIELSLSIEFQPGGESGLLRALTVLHRRRCRVLEARYESGAVAERLTLRIQAPSRHARCVEAWLSSLVDVRAVAAGAGPPAVDASPSYQSVAAEASA